jgi:hypothetical protein
MNIFNRIIISLIAGLIVFNVSSCKKDDTLRYGNVTMGNLVDGKFISDQGNTFNMVEMNTSVDLKNFRRGIMQCDVLREVGEKEYDVRVTYMDTVFTKAPVFAEEADADPEKVVEDPIHIEQAWVSGGYLNMYIIFEIQIDPFLKDSKHMVNLVIDDAASEGGKYEFTLRHNAFGETFTVAEEEEKEKLEPQVITRAENPVTWGFAGSYISFPIADLMEDETAEITLNWNSHIITEFAWRAETEEKSTKLSYSKDSFEHASLKIRSKTSVSIR